MINPLTLFNDVTLEEMARGDIAYATHEFYYAGNDPNYPIAKLAHAIYFTSLPDSRYCDLDMAVEQLRIQPYARLFEEGGFTTITAANPHPLIMDDFPYKWGWRRPLVGTPIVIPAENMIWARIWFRRVVRDLPFIPDKLAFAFTIKRYG